MLFGRMCSANKLGKKNIITLHKKKFSADRVSTWALLNGDVKIMAPNIS